MKRLFSVLVISILILGLLTAAVLQSAAKWWGSVAGRKRFLWVHLYEPHAPYAPPEPFVPENLVGKLAVAVGYVFAGDASTPYEADAPRSGRSCTGKEPTIT